MLERAAPIDAAERVFRVTLSSDRRDRYNRLRATLGDGPELQEALDFLDITPLLLGPDALTDLLALPFVRTPFAKGRFSDGSHGVLYTARELETAGREYAYWAPRYFGVHPAAPLRVRLSLLSCQFEGRAKDVRPFLGEFPWLTSDDHIECQKLGAAAKAEGLDALIAPSARHAGGTTVPIFSQGAASDPRNEGDVRYTIGADATFVITPR